MNMSKTTDFGSSASHLRSYLSQYHDLHDRRCVAYSLIFSVIFTILAVVSTGPILDSFKDEAGRLCR